MIRPNRSSITILGQRLDLLLIEDNVHLFDRDISMQLFLKIITYKKKSNIIIRQLSLRGTPTIRRGACKHFDA
jgi:hypothetical protein